MRMLSTFTSTAVCRYENGCYAEMHKQVSRLLKGDSAKITQFFIEHRTARYENKKAFEVRAIAMLLRLLITRPLLCCIG